MELYFWGKKKKEEEMQALGYPFMAYAFYV